MSKQNHVGECTLLYQDHQLNPEDFLHFVETDEFGEDWRQLKLNDDEDTWALQILIMCDPTGPPVIQGTGGLRKVRFAPKRWNVGKSGAVRVCYAYYPEHWTVLLVMAYGKNEKDNLTSEEKKGIKKYLEQTESWLIKHNY
ncbi:MAG: hypothetical protein HQ567_21045 [Candidatus Nealsonbacteria bacterium]|nr:hypothetical protein [Candidatus Nealsonbacteria bacterium]